MRTLGEQGVAGVETLQRENRFMERELERLSQGRAGLVCTGGNLAADRTDEVQERAAVLERMLREVRGKSADWAGQTVNVPEIRKTPRGDHADARQSGPVGKGGHSPAIIRLGAPICRSPKFVS